VSQKTEVESRINHLKGVEQVFGPGGGGTGENRVHELEKSVAVGR